MGGSMPTAAMDAGSCHRGAGVNLPREIEFDRRAKFSSGTRLLQLKGASSPAVQNQQAGTPERTRQQSVRLAELPEQTESVNVVPGGLDFIETIRIGRMNRWLPEELRVLNIVIAGVRGVTRHINILQLPDAAQ